MARPSIEISHYINTTTSASKVRSNAIKSIKQAGLLYTIDPPGSASKSFLSSYYSPVSSKLHQFLIWSHSACSSDTKPAQSDLCGSNGIQPQQLRSGSSVRQTYGPFGRTAHGWDALETLDGDPGIPTRVHRKASPPYRYLPPVRV